jgi:hypothetical protein
MRKQFYLLSAALLLAVSGFAQKGNNQFYVAFDLGFPTGSFENYKTGIGFSGKGLFGVGERAQATLQTGFNTFVREGSSDALKVKTSVVPILAGLRFNALRLYLEPQLGYGIYSTTTKTEVGNTESKITTTNGGFTWTVGGGLQVGSIDLGARYQAGYPGGGTVSFFGFHVGYLFTAGRK